MAKMKSNDNLGPEDVRLSDNFLKICQDKEELRDWILTFLDIDFPMGCIDPESNSSPIDWMYQAYAYIRDGRKKRPPSMVIYSARECYKTLSMSCFEFVVMCHFGVTVSHMAAIKNQSEKAVSYVSSYLRKCRKFIEYLGRSIDSAAKSHIKITETDGDESYLKVIVCTMAGANGDHTLIFCLDGYTEILIKNPDMSSNRKRLRKTAQNVFEMLESGKSIEAMSFNHNNGQYEFQPITRWSRLIQNRTQLVFNSGKQVTCTDNHEFFVIGKGYIPTLEISVGDRLVQSGRSKSNKIKLNKIYSKIPIRNFDNVNASLEQFMLGSLLGDGCIYKRKQNNGLFACTHSIKQLEYAQWKINFLNLHYPTKRVPAQSGYTGLPSVGIRSGCNEYFNQWVNFRSNLDGVEQLNPFGLAIWFQDDGSANSGLKFHTESFSYEQNIRLKTVLKQNFDIDVEVIPTKEKYFHLVGGISELYKLYAICGKFICPSMKYKFDRLKQTIKQCAVCGHEFHNFDTAPNNRACYDQVCQSVQNGSLSVHTVSAKKVLGKDFVYDFTVNEHHNLFANGFLSHNCADELDVVQYPHAFEEAKLIPGPDRGKMPLTIFTSTRKFSFGLMQKEIDNALKNNRPVLHWNIIDVTEKCQPSRYRPDEPMVTQYIARSLPLKQITPKQYEELREEDKGKYEPVEAYAGCLECPLLPVCKTRLATRPEQDVGGLYKSIEHVINTFENTNPDIAEAQLMCWKPGSVGVIYGRFTEEENSMTLEEAWERYTGDEAPPDLTINDLIDQFHRREVPFYMMGDWGYRHNYALIAAAVMPDGEWWIFETFAMSGLEFEDQFKYAKEFRDKYRPKRWFMDPAYPGNLKTFTKNGMPCKDFTKDIMFGIEAVRGQIVNSTGRRRLQVIKDSKNYTNSILVQGFKMHHFMTDAQGRVTQKPDDEEFADVMDALRYGGQNLFPPKKTADKDDHDATASALALKEQELMRQRYALQPHQAQGTTMYQQMLESTGATSAPEKGWSKSKRIFFDFSGPDQ